MRYISWAEAISILSAFKWIKQHLKIQVFWGYSFNAVKTQICIAISTFLLVAIAKKQLNVKQNLYEILQILQVSQFEKTALQSLISNTKLHFEENGGQISLDLGELVKIHDRRE